MNTNIQNIVCLGKIMSICNKQHLRRVHMYRTFFRKTLKPFVKSYRNYFRKHVHMYGFFFCKVNFVAFEILSIQNSGVE